MIVVLLVGCAPALPQASGGGAAAVPGPVVPVGEPEIRELNTTMETVWNCGSGGGTVVKHPTMSVLTSYAVEWQVGERSGVGVSIGDGVIPGSVDLSRSLEGQYSTGLEQGVQQGTSWDLPAEPNTIVMYMMMWREVWQPGYVDVTLADGNVVQVYVRYRTAIQGEIVDKQMQVCDGEPQQPTEQEPQQPATPAQPEPTQPPPPTATPLPDTAPGTVLEVGQTWRTGGLELTLVDAYYDYTPVGPPGAYLTFRLTNQKAHQITIQYNLKYSVWAVDNLGRDLTVGVTANSFIDRFEDHTLLVGSGESIYLAGWGGYGEPGLIVLVDTADLSVSEFVVTISVSSITDARWRIGVAH
jgi:hypothetical protein